VFPKRKFSKQTKQKYLRNFRSRGKTEKSKNKNKPASIKRDHKR